MLRMAIPLFCMFTLPPFIMAWLFGPASVYASEREGVGTAIMGHVFGLSGLMAVLLMMPVSRWLAGRKPHLSMLAWSVAYSVGCLLVAATDGYWLALSMIIMGEIIVVPVPSALTVLLAPDDPRGNCLGVFGVGPSLGWFRSTFIGGILYDTFDNGRIMWGILAAFGTLSALAMMPLWLRTMITRQGPG